MIKLLKVIGCWADKMYFNSHFIIEQDDNNWKNWEKIKSYTEEQMHNTDEISMCVGSNEAIYYQDAYDAFYSIREYDITPEEKEILCKYFSTEDGALHIDYFLEYILEALDRNTEK